jgi:DUF917 family protein
MLDEYIQVAIDGYPRAAVPDILAVVDPVTRTPLLPNRLRIGQSVAVLHLQQLPGWPANQEARIGLPALGIDPGPGGG